MKLKAILQFVDHCSRQKSPTSLAFLSAISFLLATLLAKDVGAWQDSTQLDHFKIDIAGEFVDKLPADTEIKINRNPDHHRYDEQVVKLDRLPARIPDYSARGCVAEFWATHRDGEKEKLFSIVVDRAMFDRYRIVTLLLNKPTPSLRPEPDCWASIRWNPKITQRMRYLDLPWLDKKSQTLAPNPHAPNLVVRNLTTGKLLEKKKVRHFRCEFDCHRGEFAEETKPDIRSGDKICFSITYDSGGLFNRMRDCFVFKYDEARHEIWK